MLLKTSKKCIQSRVHFLIMQNLNLMHDAAQLSSLNLVPVSKSDLEDIHKLHRMPETNAYNTLGIPSDLSETKAIVANWIARPKNKTAPGYVFCIKYDSNFVGLIALNTLHHTKAEVWYKIHPAYWNKGYASSSLNAIIRFGFKTLHLGSITAGCAAENTASIRVLEKAGMRRKGVTRKSMLLNTGWSDRVEYSMSIEDFEAEIANPSGIDMR